MKAFNRVKSSSDRTGRCCHWKATVIGGMASTIARDSGDGTTWINIPNWICQPAG